MNTGPTCHMDEDSERLDRDGNVVRPGFIEVVKCDPYSLREPYLRIVPPNHRIGGYVESIGYFKGRKEDLIQFAFDILRACDVEVEEQ